MSGRIRSRTEKGEQVMYNELAIRSNAAIIEYCRISMAALAGGTAGIMGLTSIWGIGFFFCSGLLLWLLLLVKAGTHWQQYYVSRKALLMSGLTSGLTTYILFWTFLYGMVHVY